MSLDIQVLAELAKHQPLKFYELRRAIPGGFRELDRAVQRLRRAFKITFDSKRGWSLMGAGMEPRLGLPYKSGGER